MCKCRQEWYVDIETAPCAGGWYVSGEARITPVVRVRGDTLWCGVCLVDALRWRRGWGGTSNTQRSTRERVNRVCVVCMGVCACVVCVCLCGLFYLEERCGAALSQQRPRWTFVPLPTREIDMTRKQSLFWPVSSQGPRTAGGETSRARRSAVAFEP